MVSELVAQAAAISFAQQQIEITGLAVPLVLLLLRFHRN